MNRPDIEDILDRKGHLTRDEDVLELCKYILGLEKALASTVTVSQVVAGIAEARKPRR